MCGQTIGRRDGMQATLFRFFRICRRGQCAEEVLPQRRVSYPQPLLAPALPGPTVRYRAQCTDIARTSGSVRRKIVEALHTKFLRGSFQPCRKATYPTWLKR